jgi:transcriptional regulator with XRE-family HTH domain
MDASIAFRENLLRLMGEQKLRAAELSKRAGLNPRAVKDIEENRVVSPKLSTVIALAEALGADPAEMMGLGARDAIKPELARFLSQYTEEEQGRILTALAAFPSAKP